MDAESAAMDDYDHYTILSPEEKAYQVAGAKMDLGRFPPSTLLKSADEYDYIPELLEEAACLVPYYNLLTETKRLIRIDDKDQFASFLKANHELVLNYPPDGILELLCKHSTVACATALLESHPNFDLDQSHYVGLSALEMAVSNLSYGMIKLLLEHGADADIECGAGATPLHIALNAFKSCYSKFWTGEESIVRLFHVFSLPELKEPLDTLRVLASHSKQVEDICICSMNIGCVRDYATLLMVAWDKLMVSSADGGGGGGLETTLVGQHISRVLSNASLQQEICEGFYFKLSSEELVKNLTTAFHVVKTMWIPVDVLERYGLSRVESLPMCELPFHITYDQDAGLDLKLGGANIPCFLPKLTSEAKERKYYVEPRQSGPILYSYIEKLMTGTSGAEAYDRSLSSVPRFQCRTLHIFNPMENRLRKTPLVKPSSHNVLALAKVCAPLMSFAKRSIK